MEMRLFFFSVAVLFCFIVCACNGGKEEADGDAATDPSSDPAADPAQDPAGDDAADVTGDVSPFANIEGGPLPGDGCRGAGEACTGNGECCGSPDLSGCAPSPQGMTCAATCDENGGCASGCCYAMSIPGKGVCVPAEGSCLPASPGEDTGSLDRVEAVTGTDCTLPGETCSANGECCGYGDTPRVSGCYSVKSVGMRCAATCAESADCASGCCVPIWGTLDSLCLPYDAYCL
jgi:hypothetical protein